MGGYYVYRSDDSGASYAQVVEIDSTNLTYTDTTVTNCPATPYYYKVVAWDCAQTDARTTASLGVQSPVYGDGSKTGADFPSTGVTDTTPVETTPPDDPANFNAIAGADKIYLSYATPASSDIKGVRILKRADQYPTAKDDPAASGPNTVADYEPVTPSQTYSLVDVNNPPANTISIGTTYFYRAFAYDLCLNYSAGTISQATAKPCGDGEVGSKHYGPP
ncbi:MAG: hypothetical protein HZB83_06295, partial [Deltaproteobacteria bacterium]|nr:hypothetical protein [Deltaproteobacteria bacterium]